MIYSLSRLRCNSGTDVIKMNLKTINFINTCIACPEQYDVYIEGNCIAYIRLRFGQLICTMPFGRKTIFEHSFEDSYKGEFTNDKERKYYLALISSKIMENLINESSG
jgi:hypothetical protein